MMIEYLRTLDGTTTAQAARTYAGIGLAVIPLHSIRADGSCSCGQRDCAENEKRRGKHPRQLGWTEKATDDEQEVDQLWNRWPDANVGLPMGGKHRLVALDIDGKAGRASLSKLQGENGPLPITLTSRSGREDGGEHRVFSVPGDLDLGAIGNTVAVAPGLDVRAQGGQIVVAPSMHYTGRHYRWTRVTDIAELPRWLYRLLTQKAKETPGTSSDNGNGETDTIPEGGRNHALTSHAGYLRRRGLSVEEIEATLLVINERRCAPPLSDGEVKKIAASVTRYEPAVATEPDDASPEAQLPDGVDLCGDLGNAYRLQQAYGDGLRYTSALGWSAWDEKRWAPDATGEAARCIHLVARTLQRQAAHQLGDAMAADDVAKTKAAKALLAWARSSQLENRIRAGLTVASTLAELATTADAFDHDRDLLNVANGTLDLRTFELRPHRRSDRITKLCPIVYDPAATSPVFDGFLARVFNCNEGLIDFVRRAVGYSLTGSTAAQCFFLLWGTGANGKSTLLEVLRRILGDYAQSTSSDTLLHAQGKRGPDNDVARLRSARFVTAAESGEGRRLDEERVKRLTGGDTITARFLYREWFEFLPDFKLWLAVNDRPEIRGTNHAIWRRVRLIPFEVTIPEDEQDRELPAKLWAEAPGILRWAVEGCRQWREGGLQPPANVTDATAEYRAEQNVVGRFVADECVIHERASCPAGMLYGRFVAWCREQGEEAVSQKAFGQRLGGDGRFKADRGNRGRYWGGLGLRAEDEAPRGGHDA